MSDAHLNAQLSNAIGAHGAWKMRLRVAAMNGDTSEVMERAGDCHACDFGRWLDGLSADLRTKPEARETIGLHEAFHKSAGRVAQMIAQGKKDAALSMLDGEFNEASSALKTAVAKWKLAATS